MGPFDHRRHRRVGDRPQRRHRLHRRERQVVAGDRLCPRPRVFRDLPGQLPRIHRRPAVLGDEELAGHLGPHPRPVSRRDRRVGRQPVARVERRDPLGHLEPERRSVVVDDLERRPQPASHPDSPAAVRSGPSSCCCRSSASGCRPQPNKARICSAVTGSPAPDRRSRPCRNRPTPRASRRVRCSRTPARCALLGRIQRRDLPGQIVIPRPGGQLVEAHRHTHPKGVHAAASGQADPSYFRQCMRCIGLRSSIASLADENWWCRPATSTHTGAGEPVEVYGAGVSGATGLLLRARGSVSWQRSLRTGAGRRWSPHGGTEGCDGGHVRPGRWSGCRQGVGDGVPAHARPRGGRRSGDADVQDDDRVVAGDAGLAGRGRGEHRGDGVDVDVLEAAVLLPRGGHGGVAAERGAHEGGARAARAMFGTRSGSRSCWSTACWRRRSCRRRRSAGCGC